MLVTISSFISKDKTSKFDIVYLDEIGNRQTYTQRLSSSSENVEIELDIEKNSICIK